MTPAPAQAPAESIVLDLPFEGRWLVQNSPERRVPSHGTDLLGERYAIDFVGVDVRRRTADRVTLRSVVATERPERFVSFGRPILAPCVGVVVDIHDSEPDHEARRSPLTLIPYLLGQRDRLGQGVAAVAGNYVILRLPNREVFVALVHLKQGSLSVGVGDHLQPGQRIAECGNSGNSTQPHVHVQAMDSRDLTIAQGIPIVFRSYREQPTGRNVFTAREFNVPREGAVVEGQHRA